MILIALTFLTLVPPHVASLIVASGAASISYTFLTIGLVGQIGMIGLCVILIAYIIYLVLGRYRFATWIVALVMAAFICLLTIDFAAYRLIGYHLSETFWNVLFSGAFFQVIVLSANDWVILAIGFLIIAGLELLLAMWLWRYHPLIWLKRIFVILSIVVFGCVIFAYVYYFTNSVPGRNIPQLARVIPYFEQIAERIHHTHKTTDLKYPKHPLISQLPEQRLNIVIIAIDTWRADMLDPVITPNIAAFAQKSLRFANHYSGGNFTRPGIFSLLYGLTPNYWYQMRRHERGPLLIHQLLKSGYEVRAFMSASPRFPDFIDTAFHEIPSAWQDTPGDSSTQRDVNITTEFEKFLKQRAKDRPFFSFLFYDEVHNWCGSDQPYAKPFQPAIQSCDRFGMSGAENPLPYINRYKNAIHFDDMLVGSVLDDLKKQGLLDSTIVIITADHGQEFNDSKRNLWGHGSAFDRYQLHVPFIVYWPGKSPRVIAYRTSHYDVVPTLMREVLGVQNPISDYSDGVSLFDVNRPPYITVGSYERYAKLYPNSVEISYPGGYHALDDLDGRPLH